MKLVPISIAEAKRYVAHHHRHHRPPQGALFALGAEHDSELVGVVLVDGGASLRAAGFVQEALLPARSHAKSNVARLRFDRSEPAARIRWGAAA